MNIRRHKTGFTLIELMIVVGIISILIVVLSLAVLPWLAKSDQRATETILQQLGAAMSDKKISPTLDRFKKDAGQLSGKISGDKRRASSQMMLFYLAPSRSTWDGAAIYKDRNYEPPLAPEQFAEFTRQEGNGLPYLVDAWDTNIWYEYEKELKGGAIYSAGENTVPGDNDDVVYDPRDGKVKTFEEIKK